MKEVKVKVQMYESTYAKVHKDGGVEIKNIETCEKLTNKNVDSLAAVAIGDNAEDVSRKVLKTTRVTRIYKVPIAAIISNGYIEEEAQDVVDPLPL